MKKLALLFMIVIMIFAVACNNDVSKLGTLVIKIDSSVAKGVETIPIEIDSYNVIVKNEAGTVIMTEIACKETSYTLYAQAGVYTVEVEALNQAGMVVGYGTAYCEIVADTTGTVSVQVSRGLSGNFMGFIEQFGYTYFFEIDDKEIRYSYYQNCICEYDAVPYTTRVTEDGIYIIYRYAEWREMDTALYIPFDEKKSAILYYEYGKDEKDPKNHKINIALTDLEDSVYIYEDTSRIGSDVYNVRYVHDSELLAQLVDHYEDGELQYYGVLFFDDGFRDVEFDYDGKGHLREINEYGCSADRDFIIFTDYFDNEGNFRYADQMNIIETLSLVQFLGFDSDGKKMADVRIDDVTYYQEFMDEVESIKLCVGTSIIARWDSKDFVWSFSTELKSFGDDLPVQAVVKLKEGVAEDEFPYTIVPDKATVSVAEGDSYAITFTVDGPEPVYEHLMGFVPRLGFTYFFEIQDKMVRYSYYQGTVNEFNEVPCRMRYTEDGVYVIFRYADWRKMDTALYIPIDENESPILYYEYGVDEKDERNRSIEIELLEADDDIYITKGTSAIGSDVYNVRYVTDGKMVAQLVSHYDGEALQYSEVLFFNEKGYRSFEFDYHIAGGELTEIVEYGGSAEEDYIIAVDHFNQDRTLRYSEQMNVLEEDSAVQFLGFDGAEKKMADVTIDDISDYVRYPEFGEEVKIVRFYVGTNIIARWDSRKYLWSFTTELKTFGENLPVKAVIEFNEGVVADEFPYTIVPNVETITVVQGELYTLDFQVIPKNEKN